MPQKKPQQPPTETRDFPAIELPRPKVSSGRSLPDSLRRRRTTREISDRKLPLQLARVADKGQSWRGGALRVEMRTILDSGVSLGSDHSWIANRAHPFDRKGSTATAADA